MAVEIKELVLRAVVLDGAVASPDGSEPGISKAEQEALVTACVREVLKILERNQER